MWKARIFTLYPEMFPGPLGRSLYAKALKKKLWDLEVINIRDSALDKHKTVDDNPFGGGSGMLLKPDVLSKSLDSNIIKGEKVNAESSGLSKREWNELMSAFDLKDKSI